MGHNNKDRNTDLIKGYHEAAPATEMQTTVRRDGSQQRHYSSPEPMPGSALLTGAAASATYISLAENIIKDDTTGHGRDYVRSSLDSSMKEHLINGPTPQAGVAITETERAMARNGVNGHDGASPGFDESTATNFKPVIVSGSFADKKLKGAESNVSHLRYASKRMREIKPEPLTGQEARLATLKKRKEPLAVAGMATLKAFGRTAGEANGSDDLGVETIKNTKNTMVGTSRTLKATKRAAKSVLQTPQNVKRSLRTMQKTAQRAQHAARAAVSGITASFRTLSNPVVLKSLAISGGLLLIIVVLMACVSSISALFSSFTYSAKDGALTDTYAYVTELDTNLEQQLKDIPTKPEWSGINVFNLTVFVPKTDPMPIISYLSVKYGAFNFKDVKGEIDRIHAAMYQVVVTPRTEVSPLTGGPNPAGTLPATDQTIKTLDVTLNYTPFQTYATLHKAEMFPKADDYAMFETYNQIGGTSLRSELGFPFVGKAVTISSRYGWRFDPVTGAKNLHAGIDIPMAAGTPINATMSGTVTTSNDPDGLGNVIVINSGNRKTLYGHCSRFIVSTGQTVKEGQEIAKVGNTGKSTGDHLHLEFVKDGKPLNPFFYIGKEQFMVGTNGGLAGAALGDAQFAAIITEGEKYLGTPYVFGGKTPQTGFDCSGFVSWVLTHSGVKQISASAQGLYDNSTPITETDMKPGDLIFFQGTYDTPDTVTHVAFYVGNGMMLQCGDPIQYSSFKTTYWQDHFYAYGRIN